MPKASSVKLAVDDVSGEQVQTLVDRHMAAGDHTAQFTADNLPSGLYFYRLQTGEFFETKKLLLMM